MDIKNNQMPLLGTKEENTTLLFYDNIVYPKSQYNIEEIFFIKAVILQQIRIVKSDSNPHPNIKSNQSVTQKSSIFHFEVFARNLKRLSDKFDCVVESCTVNKENGEKDSIFPIYSELCTNHIVIRGTFEKITLCIYGTPVNGADNHKLLESEK